MTQNPNGQYYYGQIIDFTARVNGSGAVYPVLTLVDFAGNIQKYMINPYQTANGVVLDNNMYGIQVAPQVYGDYVYMIRVYSDALHTVDVTDTRLIGESIEGSFNIVSRDLDERVEDHTMSGTFGWVMQMIKSVLKGMGWNMSDATGNTCPLEVRVKNGLGHTITIVNDKGQVVAGRIIDGPQGVTFTLPPGLYTVNDLDNCSKVSQKIAVKVDCNEPVTCKI